MPVTTVAHRREGARTNAGACDASRTRMKDDSPIEALSYNSMEAARQYFGRRSPASRALLSTTKACWKAGNGTAMERMRIGRGSIQKVSLPAWAVQGESDAVYSTC
jgi:hypothetical protein